MQKVLGVGFHKTGTSTLNAVLTELGYTVCSNDLSLAEDLIENKYERINDILDKYDAFEDNPWPLLFKEFYNKYPTAKFVLTIRDEDKWWQSLINHFGENHTKMREWIYGDGVPLGNEKLYKERYRKHNKEVKDFFNDKPNQLLIIDWSESDNNWEKICKFLNKPVPNISFPNANKLAYSRSGKLWQAIKLFYFRNFIKPKQ